MAIYQCFRHIWDFFKSPVVLFCLLLGILPVFFTVGIIRSDDGILHTYRSVLLDQALRVDAIFYPRFTSGLSFGYGASLFNFFSPFAYYPIVISQALGMSLETSWEITLSIYLFFAQLSAYILGKNITSQVSGGIFTAAAYSTAPYVLFDLTSRGSITELAALAILPLILLFIKKLILFQTVDNFIGLIISIVLFVPAHNIITIHSLFIAAPWCIFWIWKSQQPIKSISMVSLAVVLSFFATAFFWMPALGETKDVKLNVIADELDFVDVTQHLRPIIQVIDLGNSGDALELQAKTPISLNLLLLAISLLGLGVKQSLNNKFLIFLLLGIVSFCAWLNTPESAWVWQTLPFMSYSQFAWRILAVASLALALATGLAFTALYNSLQSAISKRLFFFIVGLGILSGGYPWFYRPHELQLARTVQEIHAFEAKTGQIALSSYSEYLPIAARNLNYERLAQRFDEALVISRIDPKLEVVQARWSSLGVDLVVNTTTEISLVFDWLYMPGWYAVVNQQPARVYAEAEHGLLAIDIPSGRNHVYISRSLTPLQQTATHLSLVAIFLVVPISSFLSRPRIRNIVQSSSQEWRLGLALGIIFLSFRLLVDASGSSIFKLQRWQAENFQAENPHFTRFANGMLLIASTESDVVSSNHTLEIETFWSIYSSSVERDYSLLYQLIDRRGIVVAEENRFLIGNLPTVHWLENHYVQDRLSFRLPPHTPPVDLQLRVTVYDSQNLVPVSWLNEQGNPQDVSFILDQVAIQKGHWVNSSRSVGDTTITLDEFSGLPERAQVGSEIILSLTWRLNKNVTSGDYSARLLWKCADGNQAASEWVALVDGYPVNRWQVDDVWRSLHRFYVPGQLGTSQCQVSVDVQDEQQVDDFHFSLGEIALQAPTRSYEMVKTDHPQNILWRNGVQLLGYDWRNQALQLHWSSSQPLNQSLRLFVQALNTEGQVVWQTDEVPVQWSRPTTSWDIDEIITTNHILDISLIPEVSFIVGWYDPLTGMRILLDDSIQDYAVMSLSTP